MRRSTLIVLSHFQADELLEAREKGADSASVSPDLGLTRVLVEVKPGGVVFPEEGVLVWGQVQQIASSEVGCFLLSEGGLRKIQRYSEVTHRPVSLMPTQGAPTLLVAGFPMHRIKDIEPYEDTRLKIESIAPVLGWVLDVGTCLGYTAIQAAQTAERVITVELDPAVLEVARLNPWSRELFENPRIERRLGDAMEVIRTFEDEIFTCVVHDPPNIGLSGELYAGALYQQLYRVLRRGGRLFHYVGDLEKGGGFRVAKGVMERLREAGFEQVRPLPKAFGVRARK